MADHATLAFDQTHLLQELEALSDAQADQLDFGVIGLGADGIVRRYNAEESRAAGLSLAQVMGLPLFAVVAQCMNNYLVAQRFEDSAAAGQPLDETLDYVLTLRMRPQRVRLRLLYAPGATLRYVLVKRLG